MSNYKSISNIPVAVSLESTLKEENVRSKFNNNKRRLIYISLLSICIAVVISIIAKALMMLITLITNLSFYGEFNLKPLGLINNVLGWWIVWIPAIGGIIVGLTAYFGSRGIQGHGIPEAMEQILTNKSKINPVLTFLKPLSSAIAIGTGGPFGAEGPIIATGGSLGSTIGQFLKITSTERKILLASGAAAGMTVIFGTPLASLFLAIELLLFEYSPRSIIPCVLACITALAGYHLFFRSTPVFPIDNLISAPSNAALFLYSVIGVIVGLVSVVVTKAVYWIEDLFYKIPIHWMWYPAIGGLFAGFIGYLSPHTLGVGYDNITDILSGEMAIKSVLLLCFLKLVSWSVSLASGTSGGTLAPLMTIGGGIGAGLGFLFMKIFPDSGVILPLAALTGMMSLFAGASRALITSVIFGVEATGQLNGLFPLLASCSGSFFVSFFLMKNTIMTEKIARRGVKTPDSYEPDFLEEISVGRIMHENTLVIDEQSSIQDIKEALKTHADIYQDYFIVSSHEGAYKGILRVKKLQSSTLDVKKSLKESGLIKMQDVFTYEQENVKEAMELMIDEGLQVLPVITHDTSQLKGIVTYSDIINVFKTRFEEERDVSSKSIIPKSFLKFKGHHLQNQKPD